MQKSKPVRHHTNYALQFFCLTAVMGFANIRKPEGYAGGNVESLLQDRRHCLTKRLIVLYVMSCGWASNVPA